MLVKKALFFAQFASDLFSLANLIAPSLNYLIENFGEYDVLLWVVFYISDIGAWNYKKIILKNIDNTCVTRVSHEAFLSVWVIRLTLNFVVFSSQQAWIINSSQYTSMKVESSMLSSRKISNFAIFCVSFVWKFIGITENSTVYSHRIYSMWIMSNIIIQARKWRLFLQKFICNAHTRI